MILAHMGGNMTGDGTRTSLERMGSHQLRPIKKSTLDKKKRLESIRRHKNVTVIQAIWRGHRARKISPFCADSSLASVSGNNQIDHNNDNSNGFGFMPNNLSSIPHNPEAKTTYLFPQHDNQKDDEENQSRENTEGFLKEPIHVGDGEAKDLIHLAEKKKEEEENHLKQGVIAVIMLGVYFLCATVLYSKMLKISYFHALYFCVVTVTTIGFGDISPHEDVPKLLTTVAIFAGLATFTIGITFLLDFFAKEKERLDELLISRKFEAENKIEMDVKCGVDISEDEDNEESCDANESFEIMSGRSASLCSRVVNRIPALIREALSSMLMAVLTIVVTVVLGAIFFMFVVDSMDFVDAVYFCAVIISSVGFGDIVPQSDRARLFVIFYGILGTGMTANALSKFSAGISCVINYHRQEEESAEDELGEEVFALMDCDGDGQVVKAEFILYKLVRMGLVRPEHLKNCSEQFARLDFDGNGYLSQEDVDAFHEAVTKKNRSGKNKRK